MESELIDLRPLRNRPDLNSLKEVKRELEIVREKYEALMLKKSEYN